MDSQILQIFPSMVFSIIAMGVFLLGTRFLSDRRREKQEELELRRIELTKQNSIMEPLSKNEKEVVVDPSGYIIINLPDSQKTLFIDLLKGFEEYAILRGYKISFAFDGSIHDKVAFRFTVVSGGYTVSNDKVKKDIQEYIQKVENGESFDDLDIIISPEQHHMTLLILKNRLSFLQNTYTTQKNALQLYEQMIKTFSLNFVAPSTPQIYIQGHGTVAPTIYSAVNSQQIAQGQHVKMIGNSADQKIHIGNTVNERKMTADMIDKIISLLWKEKDNFNEARNAQKYLEKAKDEICDEIEPDKSRLQRYLEKAREIFTSASFAKEAVDAFKDLLSMVFGQ